MDYYHLYLLYLDRLAHSANPTAVKDAMVYDEWLYEYKLMMKADAAEAEGDYE